MSSGTEVADPATTGDNLILDDLKLPAYIPMHRHMVREVESASKVAKTLDIEDMINDTIANCYTFMDFVFSLESTEWHTRPLDNNLQALRDLYLYKFQDEFLQTSLSSAKKSYAELTQDESLLNLDTWPEFMDKTNSQFGDFIIEQLTDEIDQKKFETWLSRQKPYQSIKYLPIILQNPEEPIPDENDDNDDLNIAGGKVSLKDPITLRIFTNPVIGKCGHTYERDSIKQQMTNSRTTCAISGCEAVIEERHLIEDKIMELRVKAFNHIQKSGKKDQSGLVL